MRFQFIDAVKGFAVILMILGHQQIGQVPYLGKVIYSFHMPLFFIVSGMFLKPMPIMAAVRKYAVRLLLPYYVVAIIALLSVWLAGYFFAVKVDDWAEDLLMRVAYTSGSFGSRYLSDIPIIGPLWFLWALFWGCSLWSFISNRYSGVRKYSIVMGLVIPAIVSAKIIQLPFCIQSGLLSLVYLEIGYQARRHNVIRSVANELECLVFPFMLFSLARMYYGGWYCCGYLNLGDAQSFVYSVVAPVFILAFAYRFVNKDFLGIGANTLAILCGHSLYKIMVIYFGNPLRFVCCPPGCNLAFYFCFDIAISFALGITAIP